MNHELKSREIELLRERSSENEDAEKNRVREDIEKYAEKSTYLKEVKQT